MKKFKMPSFVNKTKLKYGTYSAIVIALVLTGIVAFNILISVVSDSFKLEYDMTADKIHSIDEDNIEYIEAIKTPVKVTICALKEEYLVDINAVIASDYERQGVYFDTTQDYSPYYTQTFELVEKYESYNDNITVEFLDTQDSAYAEIKSKYSSENLKYGDIIVTSEVNGAERHKIISYEDIYDIVTDDSMAMYYGYSTAYIQGNNVETALTSAIVYTVNEKDTTVAFLTGHSKDDLTEAYIEMLETNNYKVDIISDKFVTEISNKYDAIFIIGPTSDFSEDEIDVISDVLDNGEKYDKGLVFAADASAPYLPNIYGFLEEWGIEIEEGILFETGDYHEPNMPTTLWSIPYTDSGDKILSGMNYCITSRNVAMMPAFETSGDKTATGWFITSDSVVKAPIGTSDSWNGYEDYEATIYCTAIHSQRSTYDKNNDLIKNNVIVFSSTDFVYSDFMEYQQTSNKNIAFKAAERAVGAEDTGISFVPKVITDESFAASITETSANTIFWLFVVAVPVICVAVCVFVCIRRRRS